MDDLLLDKKSRTRVVVSLFFATFSSMVGIGIIAPILPLYAETLGATKLWIGIIFSGFSFSKLVFMPLMGRLSDLKGRKAFIATGLLIYIPVSLGYIIADSPFYLTLVRIGQGFAAAMIVPIAQAYMGEITPDGKEGKYMGAFMMALYGGFAFGPLMGGHINDRWGYDADFYALSTLSLLAFLFVIIFLPELGLHKKREALPSRAYRSMLGSRWISTLLMLRFMNALCTGAIVAFLPLYGKQQMDLTASQIGLILSANILFVSILQGPFGWIADRLNRKAMVITGETIFFGLLCLISSTQTFLQLMILSMFFGIAVAFSAPSMTAIMVIETRRFGLGSAMSLYNVALNLGTMCGPLLAGLLADSVGIGPMYIYFGLAGVLFALYFALVYKLPDRRKPDTPTE